MSDLLKNYQYPIITGKPGGLSPTTRPKTTPQSGASFQEMLDKAMDSGNTAAQKLNFSRHAVARTQQRGIQISPTDLERLGQAVEKAQQKGLTDTLVLLNNNAFIVNIPNRVVVTVVDGDDQENNVFTNIDGAVIL